MRRPLLSVVVPTRERADVLSETLASLVSLKMQEVEFIICDNASTDHTQAVVAGYADSRIRYSRSDKRISMPENFERGLLLATGEYVLTMGDDDFLIEENLELALAKAMQEDCELIYWFRGCFYWGSYPNPDLASVFSIPVGRGHFSVDPITLLNLAYLGYVDYFYLPSAYNSLCSRAFLKRYREHLRGQYFPSYVVALDAFSALAFCSIAPSVYFQQSPATVSGVSHHSNGMSVYTGGGEASRFIKELGLAENSHIMPEHFKSAVLPVTATAINDLLILTDFFNVATNLLRFSSRSAPNLDLLAQTRLCRLLSGGHIQMDKDSELYRKVILGNESAPVVQEDLATYFFKLWAIPIPQAYTGKFESNVATVRHLSAHLVSIGFNAAMPA